MLRQAVEIENNNNTRHFGGYCTSDNRIVLGNRLIRSGLPGGFSRSDITFLKERYGLHTVVDVRGWEEVQKEPGLEAEGVNNINLPLVQEKAQGKNVHAANKLATRYENVWIQIFQALGGTAEAIRQELTQTYIALVSEPYSQEKIRQFFELLLENSDGCILFHCTGGKDRTGVLAFLFLLALEVPLSVCMEDYLLTNRFWESYIDEQLAELAKETDDPEILKGIRHLLGVEEEYMKEALEAIHKNYGSADAYFHKALNLNQEKRNRLKALYTKEAK